MKKRNTEENHKKYYFKDTLFWFFHWVLQILLRLYKNTFSKSLITRRRHSAIKMQVIFYFYLHVMRSECRCKNQTFFSLNHLLIKSVFLKHLLINFTERNIHNCICTQKIALSVKIIYYVLCLCNAHSVSTQHNCTEITHVCNNSEGCDDNINLSVNAVNPHMLKIEKIV